MLVLCSDTQQWHAFSGIHSSGKPGITSIQTERKRIQGSSLMLERKVRTASYANHGQLFDLEKGHQESQGHSHNV